jgi:hypothetical protein
VTLYPAGYMGLRLEGMRREENLPIEVAWERAVKMRLGAEATERLKKNGAKSGIPYAHYVRQRCENATRLASISWAYLKVLQAAYKQLQPTRFEDLLVLDHKRLI